MAKSKLITREDIIDDVYNEMKISGFGISKSTIDKVLTIADDIRKSRFVQGEVIDLGFCSIEPKVRRVNNNVGMTEGFTIKVKGTLYRDVRDQCIKREKSKEEE